MVKKHPSKKVTRDAAKELSKRGGSKKAKEFEGSIVSSAGNKKKKPKK